MTAPLYGREGTIALDVSATAIAVTGIRSAGTLRFRLIIEYEPACIC